MLKRMLLSVISSVSLMVHAAEVPEISQQEVLQLDKAQHLIVDVRTAEEYLAGHVPGAVNFPLSKLKEAEHLIPLDKNKTLVLYCRSGYRAGKAANILKRHSYSKLLHLKGDMLGWEAENLPIEK